MEIANICTILGGKKVLKHDLKSSMDFVELSKKGVPKAALLNLAKYTGYTLKQMASLLPVTERTLQRYTRNQTFNRALSEQIIEIAHVVDRGVHVFGSKEKFIEWMNARSPALADLRPFDLLASRFGTDMILDELGRIEHGVFA